MLTDSDLQALWLTARLAGVVTFILLLVGTPIAWWLARTKKWWKGPIGAVVALPLVLPPSVLGFYLLLAMGPHGPVGQLTQALGVGPLPFTFWGLVVASVFYSLPFMVQPLQTAFEAVGDRPLEVAATLRASPLDAFFTVAVPLAAPGFLTASILTFAHTVGEFGVVLMIGGNLPSVTRVASVQIYDHVEALEYMQAHRLSAGVVLVSDRAFEIFPHELARSFEDRVIRRALFRDALARCPRSAEEPPADRAWALDLRAALLTDLDELRRSEARFRQVVEGSPGPTALVDRHARITLVNGALEQLFGASREHLIGASIDMLIPPRYREHHGALFLSFFAAPRARDMAGRKALNALRANGEEFPVEIALNPVELGGEPHVIATIIDISATKAAREALERALADKTALLNEVHHRVKNNLQVISSLLNLQRRVAPADAQEFLAESQLRVRAMALIHELLYEQGEAASIGLSDYLQRLVRLLQESAGGVGAVVQLTFRHDGFEVALDPQRAVPCGLLVTELVTNAYKHAFAGRREGRVDVELAPHGAGARLSVIDDGIGLPAGLGLGGTRSLGFQLIPMLVNQMNASLVTGTGPGCRFDLHFAA